MMGNGWIYVLGLAGLLGVPTVLIFATLYHLAPGLEPVEVQIVQMGPPASTPPAIPVSAPLPAAPARAGHGHDSNDGHSRYLGRSGDPSQHLNAGPAGQDADQRERGRNDRR